ncbi:MAG: hypothetical protein KTR32_09880 [Granulosicoccus sp.]|nr:hypothetical protein [Granulosicoccus sp.]
MKHPQPYQDNDSDSPIYDSSLPASQYRTSRILDRVTDWLGAFWNEPELVNASGPLRRDWILVGILLLLTLAEGIYRENVIWRPLSIALSITLLLAIPWRRLLPFGMVVIVFGATASVHIASLLLGVDWVGLTTDVVVVIFPYALLRWSSGRKAAVGLSIAALSVSTAMAQEGHSWIEYIGASLFVLFPAALGASVRYRNAVQQRDKEQVRLQEREQLARELHDTVAHHISAIAIQAQAGRAMAKTDSQVPIDALERIEEAASRTLIEMRLIVQALRTEGSTQRSSGTTLADVERLGSDGGYPFLVNVSLEGELVGLNSMLQSTLYRLAQEAVTNAARHAVRAQTVAITIFGDSRQVRITIEDDGEVVKDRQTAGFGLRGMAERVALNSGSLRTGPGAIRGWIVEATLPK